MGVASVLDEWSQFEDKDIDIENLVRIGSGKSKVEGLWSEVGVHVAQGRTPLSEVVEQLGPWLTSTEVSNRTAGTGLLALLLAELLSPTFSSGFRIPQVAGNPVKERRRRKKPKNSRGPTLTLHFSSERSRQFLCGSFARCCLHSRSSPRHFGFAQK